MTHVVELIVEPRDVIGKSSKKLGREDGIPGVVYGPKFEATPVTVDRRVFERLMHEASVGSTLVDLTIEGRDKPVDVIIKEVRRDVLKGTVEHIDFWAVDMSETIQTTVAIDFIGSAEGERAGGVLMHAARELRIEARPKDLPEHVEVDVSALEIGESLTVADIAAPKGVTFLDDPETTLASVAAPAAEEVEEEAAEGIEPGEVPEVGKESEAAEAEAE
jgi:large subunit ribosomal protein L25